MAVEIELNDLTSGTLDGTGIFDKLMAATKAHLEAEYKKDRIKGPEYSTVYLGALDNVMSSSMQFLLQKAAIGLQADLLTQQILLAQIEVQKAQIALEIMAIQKLKTTAELAQTEAQTALLGQQKTNLAAEALNIPKQGLLIDAQAAQAGQQVQNLIAEKLSIDARTLLTGQQKTNLAAEALNIPKQGMMIDAQTAQAAQQTLNLVSEKLAIIARTDLVIQQKLNGVIEGLVLEAQKCKLQAEFDLTVNTNTKTTQEIALLAQKTATEKAQVLAAGVDPDSVVGRQKDLYKAQTDGFQRDAEQKAAKLLVDTWSARRMSDEGTPANPINMLDDAAVGRVVNKVLLGVNA